MLVSGVDDPVATGAWCLVINPIDHWARIGGVGITWNERAYDAGAIARNTRVNERGFAFSCEVRT